MHYCVDSVYLLSIHFFVYTFCLSASGRNVGFCLVSMFFAWEPHIV